MNVNKSSSGGGTRAEWTSCKSNIITGNFFTISDNNYYKIMLMKPLIMGGAATSIIGGVIYSYRPYCKSKMHDNGFYSCGIKQIH